MTLAATDPGTVARSRAASLPLAPVLCATLAGVFLFSLPNLIDPIIRHDDYPAFFAEPELFYSKTLNEGRWLNYVWHLREVVTPAWLNFALYQAMWALFCAGLAVAAMGRDGPRWFAVVLALMVAVAPAEILISLWFNTLIPGMALVGLFAWLACRLTSGQLRMLLPVFVIATFMAYTTFPLLVLAVCIARTETRSHTDLVLLIGLFVASFAAAVLTTYAINWQVHGVFGVPLADWREAAPAESVADLLANLSKFTRSVGGFVEHTAYHFTPATIFHLAMFGGATMILRRRAPFEALYILAGLIIGFGLVLAQCLKLGVFVPTRAFAFVWVFYAMMIVRAAVHLGLGSALGPRMARNALLLIVGSYLLQAFLQYTTYRDWQAETRAFAPTVAAAEAPIYLRGDVMEMASAKKALIQFESAMVSRMRLLTGREVTLCTRDADGCEAAEAGPGTVLDLP